MYRFRAESVLVTFSLGGLLLSLIATFSGGAVGAIAMLLSSFFLSITWPTVLGLAIQGQGPLMKIATALVCMGGAVGGFAYQFLAVSWGPHAVQYGMLVPLVSYAVLFVFALQCSRLTGVRAESPAAAASEPLV